MDCSPCGESTAANAAESAAMGHATLAYHAQNMSIVIVPVWVSDLVVERASEESKKRVSEESGREAVKRVEESE